MGIQYTFATKFTFNIFISFFVDWSLYRRYNNITIDYFVL